MKKLTTKLLAYLLIISMLMPMVPVMKTEASSGSNVTNQPMLTADTAPPVVSNLRFLQKDQMIPASNKEVAFTFDAYDSHGTALSTNKSTAVFYVPNNMVSEEYGCTVEADSLTFVTNPKTGVTTYTLTFKLDSNWEGLIQIRDLNISDEEGNAAEYRFYDHENNVCSMNATIEIPVDNNISINAITANVSGINTTFNGSHLAITLTDTHLEEYIPLEVIVTSTHGFNQDEELCLYFVNSENRVEETYVYYDTATSSFKGNLYVNYNRGTDTYELKYVKFHGKRIGLNQSFTFAVTQTNSDKTAPVVTDLYFTVDGVRQDPGKEFKVTAANSVKLVATVSDASKVDRGWIWLRTDLRDVPKDGMDVNFNYDQISGTWIATMPLSTLNPTEWYVEGIYFVDIYENDSGTEEAEANLKRELPSHYFILSTADGTMMIPTNDVVIHLKTVNGDVDYIIKDMKRVTTLAEILNAKPADTPLDTSIDGATQVGWYIEDKEKSIQPNDKLYISWDHVWFAPEYDDAYIRAILSYVDENDRIQYSEKILKGTYGTTTVQDIVNQMDIQSAQHSTVAGYQGWEYMGAFDSLQDTLNPANTTIFVRGEYQKVKVEFNYTYIDEYGRWQWDWIEHFFNKGITYEDAVAEFAKINISHDKDAIFKQWILTNASDYDNMKEAIDYNANFNFVGEYNNAKVPVTIFYYDEDNNQQSYYQEIKYKSGDTWQKIYDGLSKELASIKQSKTYGVDGWDLLLPERAQLSDRIDPQHLMEGMTIIAKYQKYPHTYRYAYLTTTGEVKEVEDFKLVAPGTKAMDYYDTIYQNLPADADKQKTLDGWRYNNHVGMWEPDGVISTLTCESSLALAYTDAVPAFVVLDTIEKDLSENVNMPTGRLMVCYTDPSLSGMAADQQVVDQVKARDTFSTKDYRIDGYALWERDLDASGTANCKRGENIRVKVLFENVVLYLVYPDETCEIKFVKHGDSYQLSDKYKGKTIEWYVEELDNSYVVAGNTSITLNHTPYVIAYASEAQNSGSAGNGKPSNNSGNSGNNGNNANANQNQNTSAPVVYPAPVVTNPLSSSTATPTTPSAPVVAVGLEKKAVNDAKKEIKKAQPGTTVTVDMTTSSGKTATVVPADILEEIKGKDVTVVLDMGGYSWEINGKDVHAPSLKDINLEVSLDTNAVAPSVINSIANGDPTRQLSLTHNGDFGFKGKLTVNVGNQYAGQFGNLYYYDSNNKLIFQNAGLINSDGSVTLDFSHASDYVVVMSEEAHEPKEETEEVVEEEVTVEEEAEVETVEEETAEKEAGLPIVPIIIIVVAIILVVAFVATRKRNDEE